MRIAVAADERTGIADAVVDELRRRGHEPATHGALSDAERDDWAWASEAAARDVAEGRAEQAVVCCWTGHRRLDRREQGRRRAGGAVPRRPDARPARGAGTTPTCSRSASAPPPRRELGEILDAWFEAAPSAEPDDRANVEHLAEIEGHGES